MRCHRLQLLWYLLVRAKRKRTSMELINPAVMLCLGLLGIAFIASVQSGDAVVHLKWKLQVVWFCLGLGVYYLLSNIHYRIFFQNAHWFFIISVILLALLWTPLGKTIGGSRRWLLLGNVHLQASDVSKIATILLVASILTRSQFTTFATIVRTLWHLFWSTGLLCLLIFLQPDLGSALVLPIIVFGMLFVSDLKLKFFVGTLLLCLLGLGMVALDLTGYHHQISEKPSVLRPFLPLKDYQRKRLLSFVAPDTIDLNGTTVNWQVRQSLIAIGSGSIFGKGWRHGTQARLGFLPKAASLDDFIFAVLAEEIGLIGSCFVLVLYGILILNTFRIATMARDPFGSYLCVGVALMMLTHIWINIGMTLGIMPTTGLPAPFLSYGGSFLLICFACQGLVQSVYRFRFADE